MQWNAEGAALEMFFKVQQLHQLHTIHFWMNFHAQLFFQHQDKSDYARIKRYIMEAVHESERGT
jgi:hypothetical protein